MNDHIHDYSSDPVLQARLRALPAERLPPARVWEQIAAQLPAAPSAPSAPLTARRQRRRWPLRVGLGLAAGLAVLLVVPTAQPPVVQPSPLQHQADAIAQEYQQAIATLPTDTLAPDWQPTLHELDRSAASIRAAIAENPRSRYLLGQLQRTYALRLELTQQALNAAGLPS